MGESGRERQMSVLSGGMLGKVWDIGCSGGLSGPIELCQLKLWVSKYSSRMHFVKDYFKN